MDLRQFLVENTRREGTLYLPQAPALDFMLSFGLMNHTGLRILCVLYRFGTISWHFCTLFGLNLRIGSGKIHRLTVRHRNSDGYLFPSGHERRPPPDIVRAGE